MFGSSENSLMFLVLLFRDQADGCVFHPNHLDGVDPEVLEIYHRTNSKLQDIFEQDKEDASRAEEEAGSVVGSKSTRSSVHESAQTRMSS